MKINNGVLLSLMILVIAGIVVIRLLENSRADSMEERLELLEVSNSDIVNTIQISHNRFNSKIDSLNLVIAELGEENEELKEQLVTIEEEVATNTTMSEVWGEDIFRLHEWFWMYHGVDYKEKLNK